MEYSNLNKDYTHNHKRSPTSDPNKAEKYHHDRLRDMGCLVCGRPPAIHHIMSETSKRCRRDHEWVAPICYDHHQGQDGVHGKNVGSEAKFLEVYGIDLVKFAKEEWEISCQLLL